MKDILLFGTIWQYSALFFFDQVKEATEDNAEAQMVLRVNTEGGSPEYGMSVIEKVQEMSDQFLIKGGAMLHSMGLFLFAYVPKDKTECIDTTVGVLHRAAYPDYIEKSSTFPESIFSEALAKMNKKLEQAFRNRVDVKALEALPQFVDKNITLKDIFDLTKRTEVLLSANDMKAIGLVGKINRITPMKSEELKAQMAAFNKCREPEDFRMAAQTVRMAAQNPTIQTQQNNTIMTLADLKKDHPSIYALAKAEGVAEGITAGTATEKDRIEAAMVFSHVDPKMVAEIVASGKPMTMKQQAELLLKAQNPAILAAIAAGSPPAIEAGAVKTAEQLKAEELKVEEAKLRADLGLPPIGGKTTNANAPVIGLVQ